MTPQIRALATNFGKDEQQARRDAIRLSAALGQSVVFWQEEGSWLVLNASRTVGKELDFEHELISYK